MKKPVLKISFIILALFSFSSVAGQIFTDSGISMTGVNNSVFWGDYDNDNDLDILLSGSYRTIIYRNDNGVFINISSALEGVDGPAIWGDYDNDGDLDVFLAGYSNFGAISRIYRNDAGVFTDINAGLPGVSQAAADWGDCDNDGDLDLLLAGRSASTNAYIARLFINDNGSFSDAGAGLPGCAYGSALFGDTDNDGDLDILLAGVLNSSLAFAGVYSNENGTFKQTNSSIKGITQGSAAFGDYDSDGDLDLAIAGYSFAKIYKNESGVFSELNSPSLIGSDFADVTWSDYDNDGDLDLAITAPSSSRITRIYNNSNGVFTEANTGLSQDGRYAMAWGDYDKDGDLDILITTTSGSNILKNNSTSPNTAPAAPGGLSSAITSTGVTLTWNASTDGQTPAKGLTYNIYIGTSSGAVNKKSPMSNVSTGLRKIVQKGTILTNSWIIRRLPAGTYYWSVQAIDNEFSGSSFATQASFTVPFLNTISPATDQNLVTSQGSAVLTVNESSAVTSRQWKYSTTSGGPYNNSIAGATGTTCAPSFSSKGIFYVICESVKAGISYISNQVKIIVSDFSYQEGIPLEGIYNCSAAWGDYDNDGDLDLLTSGNNGTSDVTNIYRNDLGAFNNISAGLQGVSGGSVCWGDYDNDADLDVLVAGSSYTKIYSNSSGTFTDIYAALPGISNGSAEWGDYDNDGDLDILLVGQTSTSNITSIYRNDSNIYTDLKAGLISGSNAAATWGDYDSDGDLDILYAGSPSKVYRNDKGIFVDINAVLVSVSSPSASWGDYDNDGDLDILIAGSNYSKIYNNDAGVFTDISASFPLLANPSSSWGDYDNDGDLDIFMTGSDYTYILRNDIGVFNEILSALTGVSDGHISCADYDNDKDLDLLLCGKTSTGYIAGLYKNNTSTANPNAAPSAPENLKASSAANFVILSWDKAVDSSTPSEGLGYNLYIGSSAGYAGIKSPMSAIPGGFRRVVLKGTQSDSVRINNLPSGTYYWSVQAVDNSYAGSPFAREQTFNVAYSTSIKPVAEQTILINQNGTALTVQESSPANSRQWKYSGTSGGPYNNLITGATGTSFIPNFPDWGVYYVICESLSNGITYTSNEIRINIPLFSGEISIPVYYNSRSSSWGDYDNDGDLDILVIASNNSLIFRNDGAGFTEIVPSFTNYNSSSGKWGDFDNDGDLDVLLAGPSSTHICRNDAGVFTDISAGLTGGGYYPNCAWFDYDSDGDLDVLSTGNYSTKVYRNDNLIFTDTGAEITGFNDRVILDCADYDNDGDPDIALGGYSQYGYISAIYRNDKGVFRNINAGLTPMAYGASALYWGDYDNDGDLDLLLSGPAYFGNTLSTMTKIYRNDNGVFADINATLHGIAYGSAAWGDFDNDGDLDIILTGVSSVGTILITKIYRNDNGSFSEVSSDLTGVRDGSCSTGDYDNDGDLDILITGRDNMGNYRMIVARNNITSANSRPTAPISLTTSNTAGKMNLSWNRSSDSKTPQGGLSYNLYIGSASRGINRRSPMSSVPGGFRRIASRGPEQKNSWAIKNLPVGTYYWGVQAVDHSFAGSDFSAESTFSVPFSVSVSPLTEQIIDPGQAGNTLTVTESSIPSSRQWKYSTAAGGPYDKVITGATAIAYTPSVADFTTFGTYYVVCQSVHNLITYTTDEVKIRIRLFSEHAGTGSVYSAGSYGDYDNDGDLDVLWTGSTSSTTYNTMLFRKDPGDGYTLINNHGMTPVNNGAVDWGDYDNDGDLDVLLAGNAGSTRITKVYNNNAGVFTCVADLFGIYYGSASWGDYDNDGDLDILITGSAFADIYRNDSGTFSRVNAGFPDLSYSTAAWGDYDSDGDLDVLLSGSTGSQVISEIYRNDNGSYTCLNAGLAGVAYSSLAWGDYDSDGDLDILISGLPSTNVYAGILPVTSIYRNNAGAFTDISAGLPGVYRGNVAWGDYDIDGDLDILITGMASIADAISKVFRNDNGAFNDSNAEIKALKLGAAYWVDYDNDTDLDITISGFGSSGYADAIYENLIINTVAPAAVANTPPAKPTNPQASIAPNKITLSWTKSTDTKTAQNGLTYNVYIGSTTGTGNRKSSMSVVPIGYRKIIRAGSHANSYSVKNLPAGTYYWSVQAIDNCFAGSVFATEATFTVAYANSISPVADQTISVNQVGTTLSVSETTPADSRQWKYSTVSGGPYDNIISGAIGTTYTPKFTEWGKYYVVCVSNKNSVAYTTNEVIINVPLFMEDKEIILPGAYGGFAKWGDYDNDGDLDLVHAGYSLSGYISNIFRNDAGSFSNISANIPQFYNGSGAWADYDGDSDLDLIITGYAQSPVNSFTKIYRNDSGIFTDIGAQLPGLQYGTVSWGDYDNDGDPDFILTGYLSSTTYITKIFRNDRTRFSDIHAAVEQVYRGFAEWGDYDNDGDLDLILSGTGSASPYVTKVYKNTNGNFADIGASLIQLARGSGAWGDYDNDGDLDILITGNTGTESLSKIYRNDEGIFYDINAGLPGVQYSSVAWGDYDNDGDLDILIAGTGLTGLISKIYRNNNGTFTEISTGLPVITSGTVNWGDYDGDGDLDILLTGNSTTSYITKVYRNTYAVANTAPAVPANPVTVPVDMDKVILTWDKASDTQTTQKTLTYNVRFGITSKGNELSPSMSGSTGYRQVPVPGNAGFRNTGFPMENLIAGTAYYWSVQTVDQSYLGSAWSAEKAFTLLPSPVANKATALSHTGFTANWTTSAGAAGYVIDVATDNTFTTMVAGYNGKDAGTATSLAITGLSPVTTYYYRITPYVTGALSLYLSNTIETATLPVPPSAPAGLSASSCNDKVTLTWSAITTPYTFIRYRIYGGTSPDPVTLLDSTATGQISETTKTIANLAHGQTYYFRVRGVIQQGVPGDFSTSTNVQIKTGVIPEIKAKWGNLLIAYNKGDSISAFQWYNGTNPISGATKQYYLTNRQSGNYHVQVIDKNGCTNLSKAINIGTKSLSLYPNPASGSFTMTLKSESTGKTIVRIFSSSGIKILEYQTEKNDPELISDIDIHSLQSGIYSVEVLVDNEEKLDIRLVVIK